jgi:hypothetical protein
MACQRNRCFNDCNGRGLCLPMKILAQRDGRDYTIPWDAMKIYGCFCDVGYRGPDCSLRVSYRLTFLMFNAKLLVSFAGMSLSTRSARWVW